MRLLPLLLAMGCGPGGGSGYVRHVPQGTADPTPSPYPAFDLTPFGRSAADAPVEIPAQAWSRDVAAPGYLDGAPVGGLGAGSVTWRYDGRFYQDRLNIGSATITPDPNSGFSFYQKPASGAASATRLDGAALGAGQATYYALFPRAWVDYHGSAFSCKARVEQSSPLIPGDYRRSSYPVAVYRWELSNPGQEPCEAAVMLTWQNAFGGAFAESVTAGDTTGLILRRAGTERAASEREGEVTLAARAPAGVEVSFASGARGTLQSDFAADGLLANTTGAHGVGGIAVKSTLEPGARVVVPIVLAWDAPIAEAGGRGWYREYTRTFGRTGLASWTIASEALADYTAWQAAIESWQGQVLADARYPNWLKRALFNELYYYLAGGTYWEGGAAWGRDDDRDDEDMFTSLESFQYPFYGTSDVRFYGSWALAALWPEIDKQEVKQFCDSVVNSRPDRPRALGTCAHDVGDLSSVFTAWNAYTYRDSTSWKDLNSKLVLMVYRDWVLGERTDRGFLDYCWPAVKVAMDKVHSQDSDGNGLPDSTGIDQTYDDMALSGNTAYCGGLYLAAAAAAAEIADAQGDVERATTYRSWLEAGRASFESELWTGSYYRIDTGSAAPDRIMSDQLAGQWYARAIGLDGIVDPERARSAFTAIYENNFKKFASGTRGVVNVMRATGIVDASSSQSREAWVGTAWGVVAGMIQEGLPAQADEIGASLENTIWNTDQLWFRTPEAWDAAGEIRAPYYMRATTVWAVKHAYDLASATP